MFNIERFLKDKRPIPTQRVLQTETSNKTVAMSHEGIGQRELKSARVF